MNFPDDITILRATGSDAFGNERNDWEDDVEEIEVRGYEAIQGQLLLLPKTAPVLEGDRYRIGTETYAGDLNPVKSPSALKLYTVRLKRVED